MARHDMNFTLLNEAQGVPLSNDGVHMLISKGAAVVSTFDLDKPYLITQVSDAEDLGIDAAYDTANGVAFHQHITEFYDNAGKGAKLWIAGVAKATAYATYIASDTFTELVRGTKTSDPTMLAKIIAFAFEVPVAGQSADDFPTDVTATQALMQSVHDALWNENIRIAFILDGYNMSSTKTMTTLTTNATKTTPCAAVMVTGTKNNRVASVGLALGMLAKRSVGESIGSGISVSPAVIPNGNVYLTNQTSMLDKTISINDMNEFGAKNFLYLRKFGDNSGWYFNDDATSDLSEMSLSTISANRIANKIATDLYNYILKSINANAASAAKGRGDGVLVDANTGNAAKAWTAGKEADFYKTYIQPLKDSGDITDAAVSISGVNYTTTKKLTIDIAIVKSDPLEDVDATIRFALSI